MTIRVRACDADKHLAGIDGIFISGAKIKGSSWFYDNYGTELVDSEGHLGWRRPRREHGSTYADIGGPFTVLRNTFRSSPAHVSAQYQYGLGSGWWYDGEIHANRLGVHRDRNQLPQPVNNQTLIQLGTRGISLNPTKAHGNLGQFLGEIHELPRLAKLKDLQAAAVIFKNLWRDLKLVRYLGKPAALHYINQEFGWKPFVRDLQTFFQNTVDADKILRQLARDNGKQVTRRIRFPTASTMDTSSSTGYFSSPSLVSYLHQEPEQQFKTTHFEEHRWFVGSYRYWIPTMTRQMPFWGPDAFLQHQRLNRVVYGASVTPDLVWELTPWSWLADWCGNTGTILSNATDITVNNLTIEYAYAMCSQTWRTTWRVRSNLKGSGVIWSQAEDLQEVKGRARASPFGFGFNMDGISPYQASILGALGYSRLR